MLDHSLHFYYLTSNNTVVHLMIFCVLYICMYLYVCVCACNYHTYPYILVQIQQDLANNGGFGLLVQVMATSKVTFSL